MQYIHHVCLAAGSEAQDTLDPSVLSGRRLAACRDQMKILKVVAF